MPIGNLKARVSDLRLAGQGGLTLKAKVGEQRFGNARVS